MAAGVNDLPNPLLFWSPSWMTQFFQYGRRAQFFNFLIM